MWIIVIPQEKIIEVVELNLELQDSGRQFLWLQRHTDLSFARLFQKELKKTCEAEIQFWFIMSISVLDSRNHSNYKTKISKEK